MMTSADLYCITFCIIFALGAFFIFIDYVIVNRTNDIRYSIPHHQCLLRRPVIKRRIYPVGFRGPSYGIVVNRTRRERLSHLTVGTSASVSRPMERRSLVSISSGQGRI
jgi:hypothetical protein